MIDCDGRDRRHDDGDHFVCVMNGVSERSPSRLSCASGAAQLPHIHCRLKNSELMQKDQHNCYGADKADQE